MVATLRTRTALRSKRTRTSSFVPMTRPRQLLHCWQSTLLANLSRCCCLSFQVSVLQSLSEQVSCVFSFFVYYWGFSNWFPLSRFSVEVQCCVVFPLSSLGPVTMSCAKINKTKNNLRHLNQMFWLTLNLKLEDTLAS